MSSTDISAFPLRGWNYPGTTFDLRIFADSLFVAEGGETVLQGTPGQRATVFRTATCTANTTTKILSVPTFGLPNTTDAELNPQATYTGVVFSRQGKRLKTLFTGFSLPASFGGAASFAEWELYNQGRTLQSPPETFLTADETAALVREMLATLTGLPVDWGTATLSGGEAAVESEHVTADSLIFLAAQDDLTYGSLRVSAREVGIGFTITSSDGADRGLVAWRIEEP